MVMDCADRGSQSDGFHGQRVSDGSLEAGWGGHLGKDKDEELWYELYMLPKNSGG